MAKKQRKMLGRYIVADPAICHGKPTFTGTRIMVAQVLKQVAKGMPWDEITAEWRGDVTKEAIAEAMEARGTMDLDHNLLRAALVHGLPLKARWSVNGVPLDFDFSRARHGLCGLDEIDIGADEELQQMIIFGSYGYDGGASPWLGIRMTDGAVYGVDLERENAVFLVNSSVAQFIATFNALDSFLGIGKAFPADIETRLRDIDSVAYEESEWRSLIAAWRESASCKRDDT